MVREPVNFYSNLKLISYFLYQKYQYYWKLNTKFNNKDYKGFFLVDFFLFFFKFVSHLG